MKLKNLKNLNFGEPGAELAYLGILGPKHIFLLSCLKMIFRLWLRACWKHIGEPHLMKLKNLKNLNFGEPGAELPYLGIMGPKHISVHILA